MMWKVLASIIPALTLMGPSSAELALPLKGMLDYVESPSEQLNGVNQECLDHLRAYEERASNLFLTPGVEDYWALRMYDASGHLPDGVLYGSLFATGSYFACMDLSVEHPTLLGEKRNLTSFRSDRTTSEFDREPVENQTLLGEDGNLLRRRRPVSFAERNGVISIPPFPGNDPRDLVLWIARLSTCIPSSCSKDEFTIIAQDRMQNYELFDSVLSVSTPFGDSEADEEEFQALDIVMICILCAFGALALVGTALHVYRMKQGPTDNDRPEHLWEQFLLGFSIKLNIERLFDASKPKSSDVITCLNGIRFMSTSWVVLAHTYGMFEGLVQLLDIVGSLNTVFKNFLLQVLWNGYPCVDSFFFLSGCLASYLTFKELDKTKGRVNWFLFYVHRYLRLTSIYGLILLFRVSLMHFMANGPNQMVHRDYSVCKKFVWRNFLYINNFYTNDGKYSYCQSQAWYLATDMQMFLVVPLIVYPMWRWRKWFFDFIWPGLWLLASTLVLIILTDIKNWPATSQLDYEEGSDYFLRNYYMPWTRFQPYGVGIILGYILHRQKGKNIRLSPILVALGWVVAAGTGFAVVYGLNLPHIVETLDLPSKAENIFYGSFHRLAWGCALAWMVWACVSGYGGFVNTFLSWEAFAPLSRLCYVIYLIHDIVVRQLAAWLTFNMAFSHFLAALAILWVMAVSIIVSIPIVTLLEMPLLHMEKFFIGLLFAKKKSN